MLGSFLPPVVFEITANAGQAIATFKGVGTQLKLLEAQALKTGVAITGMQRATIAATAFLKGFGLVTAAVVAVGIHEFGQLEKNVTQLGQAMANAGVNTAEYRKQVEETLAANEKFGFDAADTAKAMGVLVSATGNVEKSQKLLTTAMDLARFKTMGIEEAARLMARATQGSAKAFKEFGITLDTTKPKAVAAQEAIDKLSEKLKGQAEAYLKTFRGQMSLLQVNLQNFAEAVGSVVVPALNKMIAGIKEIVGWLGKHKDILVAIAAVMTGVLVAAIVLVTKKLWAQAVAWAAANWEIVLITAAIVGAVAAFIHFWNTSENVRKAVIGFAKAMTWVGEIVVGILGGLSVAFMQLVKVVALAQIGLGKLFNKKDMVETGRETIKMVDGWTNKVENLKNSFQAARDKLDTLVDKKIDTSKFKLPELAFNIPEFKNGMNTVEDSVGKVNEALVKAKQSLLDFNTALGKTAFELKTTWQSIVGRDIAGAIQEGLLNPIDKLVVQAQKAVDSYQSASNEYESALTALTSAQNKYLVALEGTDVAAQAAAESALKAAEDVVNNLNDAMSSGLADIQKYQDEMINAVVDAYNQVADLESKRSQVLADAQEQRIALEKDYNAKVADIRKQYDRDVLAAQADAAKKSAELVKQSVDQLRGVYKNATYKTLGDIFSGLTFQGKYLKGGTTEKILAALGLQKNKAQTLANDAAQLAGLGFSQTFIEEVVAQGPDTGHQLAQTILKSAPESIAKMQEYWNALQTTSSHGVDAVAKKLNSGMTLATEELTAQLAQVQTDLNNTLNTLNLDLQDNLLAAFNDYSTALDAINRKTAQQILEIDGQITELNTKIVQLQTALAALAGLTAPGTKGTGLSLTGDVENYDGYVAPEIIDAISKATTDTAWAGFINFGDNLDAFANSLKTNAANTTALGSPSTNTSRLDYGLYGGTTGLRKDAAPVITVQANTNASPDDIAKAVAWTIRTSSDVQYVTSNGGSVRSSAL